MVQPTFDDGQKYTSERRAELARAIPSEEEEDEVKTYEERGRREGKRPQLLLLGKMQ